MKIIAEIGSNYRTDLDAIRCCEIAKELGADAVKFQMYDSMDLYGKDGIVEPVNPPIEILHKVCKDIDIELMCTFFNPVLLEMHDDFFQSHKIASSDCNYTALLRKVNDLGKPVYLSTGGATKQEIEWALEFLPDVNVTLMYCESDYPATNYDPRKMIKLKAFGLPWGVSDHSMELYSIPILAQRFGACVIEKHVNLLDIDGKPDSDISLNAVEFGKMVKAIKSNYIEPSHRKYKRDGEHRNIYT